MRAGREREGLPTPSLRLRVVVAVLLLLGAVLGVLVVSTDIVLGNRLEGQLRQRLVDRADVATALAGQVDSRDLARRLEGDGISAVIVSSAGKVYAEGPLAGGAVAGAGSGGSAAPEPQQSPPTPGGGPAGGPAPPQPRSDPVQVVQAGDRLSVSRDLSDGSTVELLADAGDIHRTLTQVRVVLTVSALAVLALAAIVFPLVVRRVLTPLETITGVARSITSGDRGRRLRPRQPSSELGRTATAFDEMLDQLEGAEALAVASEARLRDFVSDAAHELRTPLTGIQAAAEHVLRDDPPRAEREQVVLGLVRETQRAGRLVEDLLTMARIEDGLHLERAAVDLRSLAEDVVLARTLVHPGARLRVAGDPAAVDGDRDRLTQLIGNLVDNAIQASGPTARIDIRVESDARGGHVAVDVADDGPGVPAADRERIFDRLVRLDRSRSSRTGGSGLGLPIARGIARAHGGSLTCVEPAASGGALLRLLLPLRDVT